MAAKCWSLIRRTGLIVALCASGGMLASGGDDDPKSTGWVETTKEEPAGTHYHTFRSDAVKGEVSTYTLVGPVYFLFFAALMSVGAVISLSTLFSIVTMIGWLYLLN